VNVSPNVVINTTAGFALGGNLESGVDVVSNAVKRGKATLGVGAWTAAVNVFTNPRLFHTQRRLQRLPLCDGGR